MSTTARDKSEEFFYKVDRIKNENRYCIVKEQWRIRSKARSSREELGGTNYKWPSSNVK